MKRLFSFLLVFAMLLVMSIPVLADNLPDPAKNKENEIKSQNLTIEDGSITITNATVDKVYVIYKIFDAEIAEGKTAADENGVTYSLEPNTDVCKLLFGTVDSKIDNQYFVYDWVSHRVTLKNEHTDGVALANYLQGLVAQDIENGTKKFPYVSQKAVEPANSNEDAKVEFTGLQYGYYLVKSSLGGIATLSSSAPSVNIIDKNQTPGNVEKFVKKGDEEYSSTNNTVNIGDVVTYKIQFNATNYYGQEKIRYYEVFDVKGTGIWAEFNSFQVSIDGDQKPGYYMQGSSDALNTNNWTALGADGVWGNGSTTPDPNNAEWFLVHTGFDTYSILIPWVEQYTVNTNATDATKIDSVTIPSADVAEENVTFKYGSPVEVVITYTAAIEPNASMGHGNNTNANLFNEATVHWKTNKNTEGSSNTDKVFSETYGLTILKEDQATADNLEGAKFKVYKDATLREPLNVIPTGVDGVYMVDSLGTDAENVTGDYMDTARKYFKYLRTPDGGYIGGENKIENEDLKALYNGETAIPTNEVVTAVNGRLVILGLDEDTYYFVETEAPDGYNKLEAPFEVEVVCSTTTYNIYTDASGNTLPDNTNATYTYTYVLTEKKVGNSKGTSLPTTGGEGRMMLISVGSMLAIGFAVLMITQKKMSTYKD